MNQPGSNIYDYPEETGYIHVTENGLANQTATGVPLVRSAYLRIDALAVDLRVP